MEDLRKKLDELIQKSKGVALLDADQRGQLVSYIQSASDEDLEALYKVLLHELEVTTKVEADFKAKTFEALQEYYGTVKSALKEAKKTNLQRKDETSKKEDQIMAESILDKLNNI